MPFGIPKLIDQANKMIEHNREVVLGPQPTYTSTASAVPDVPLARPELTYFQTPSAENVYSDNTRADVDSQLGFDYNINRRNYVSNAISTVQEPGLRDQLMSEYRARTTTGYSPDGLSVDEWLQSEMFLEPIRGSASRYIPMPMITDLNPGMGGTHIRFEAQPSRDPLAMSNSEALANYGLPLVLGAVTGGPGGAAWGLAGAAGDTYAQAAVEQYLPNAPSLVKETAANAPGFLLPGQAFGGNLGPKARALGLAGSVAGPHAAGQVFTDQPELANIVGSLGGGIGGAMLGGAQMHTASEAQERLLHEPTTPQLNTQALYSLMDAVEDGRVRGEIDPRLLDTLGPNLYNGDLAAVAAKELMQNAVDATRSRSGGAIELEIDTNSRRAYQDVPPAQDDAPNARRVRIKDNGTGMTPDVMKNQFINLGGSLKEEGAAGGFGLAKITLLHNADDIEVVSTAKVGNDYITTTMTGKGADWMESGFKFKTEKNVSTDTGTEWTMTIRPEARFGDDLYSVNRFMERFNKFSRLPRANINVRINGQTWNNQTDPGIKFAPLHTLQTRGASMEMFASDNTIVSDSLSVHVLNNGLYQFTTSIFTGEISMPEHVVVDVHATSPVDSDAYPFEPSREKLREQDLKELGDWVRSDFRQAGAKAMRAQLRHVIESGVSGGGVKVIDTAGVFGRDYLYRVSEYPYLHKVTDKLTEYYQKYHKAGTVLARADGRRQASARFTGWGLGQYRGLHVYSDLIFDPLNDTSAGAAPIYPENTVLANPFEMLRAAERRANTAVDRLTTGREASDQDVIAELAGQLNAVMAHESVHSYVRTDDSPFGIYLTDLVANNGATIKAGETAFRYIITPEDLAQWREGLREYDAELQAVGGTRENLVGRASNESRGTQPRGEQTGLGLDGWLRAGLEGRVPWSSEGAQGAGGGTSPGADAGDAGRSFGGNVARPFRFRTVEPPERLGAAIDAQSDAIRTETGQYPPGDPIDVARWSGGGGGMGVQALADMANVMDFVAGQPNLYSEMAVNRDYDAPVEWADLFKSRFRPTRVQPMAGYGLVQYSVGDINLDLAQSKSPYLDVNLESNAPEVVERAIPYPEFRRKGTRWLEIGLNRATAEHGFSARNPEGAQSGSLIGLRSIISDIIENNPDVEFLAHPTDQRRWQAYQAFGMKPLYPDATNWNTASILVLDKSRFRRDKDVGARPRAKSAFSELNDQQLIAQQDAIARDENTFNYLSNALYDFVSNQSQRLMETGFRWQNEVYRSDKLYRAGRPPSGSPLVDRFGFADRIPVQHVLPKGGWKEFFGNLAKETGREPAEFARVGPQFMQGVMKAKTLDDLGNFVKRLQPEQKALQNKYGAIEAEFQARAQREMSELYSMMESGSDNPLDGMMSEEEFINALGGGESTTLPAVKQQRRSGSDYVEHQKRRNENIPPRGEQRDAWQQANAREDGEWARELMAGDNANDFNTGVNIKKIYDRFREKVDEGTADAQEIAMLAAFEGSYGSTAHGFDGSAKEGEYLPPAAGNGGNGAARRPGRGGNNGGQPPEPPRPTEGGGGPEYQPRRYSRTLGTPKEILLPGTAPLNPSGRRVLTSAMNPREGADVLRQLLMKHFGTINRARDELKLRPKKFADRKDVKGNKVFWRNRNEIRYALEENTIGDLPASIIPAAVDLNDYRQAVEARDTQYNSRWGRGWKKRTIDWLQGATEQDLMNLSPEMEERLTAYRGIERDEVSEYWPAIFEQPKGGWDNFFSTLYGRSQPGAPEFNQRRRTRVGRDPITGEVRLPGKDERNAGRIFTEDGTVLSPNARDLSQRAAGTIDFENDLGGVTHGRFGGQFGDTPPLNPNDIGVQDRYDPRLRPRTIREAVEIFGLKLRNNNPMDDIVARDIAGQRRIAKDILMRRLIAWGVARRVQHVGQVPDGWKVPKVWGFDFKPHFDARGRFIKQEGLMVPETVANLLNDAFDVTGGSDLRNVMRVGARIAGQVKLLNFVLAGAQHADVGVMRPVGSKLNLSTLRGKAKSEGVVRAALTPLELPYVWASNALIASPFLGRPFRGRLQKEWTQGFLGDLVGAGANVRATQDYVASQFGGMTKQLQRAPLIGGAVDLKIPGLELDSKPDVFVKSPVHLLNYLQGELSEGLFNGLYLNTAKHIAHDMFNSLSASHPDWSREHLLNATANNLNTIMGSVENWDSVMSNEGVRDALRMGLTSVSENEGFVRMFVRGLGGLWDAGEKVLENTTDRVVDTRRARSALAQNVLREKFLGSTHAQPELGRNRASQAMSGYWLNYWAGYFVAMFILAQGINKAATGEFLDEDSLLPFKGGANGPDFNSKFLRPIIGFTALNQPIYLDLFGQMDTPLRWAFSPDKALKNRLSSSARFLKQAYENKSYDGLQYSDDPNRFKNAIERIRKSGWEAIQPISADNIQEAWELDSPYGMVASGMSLNSYPGGLPDVRNIEAQQRFNKDFNELDPAQKEEIRKLPNVMQLTQEQKDYYAARGDVTSVAADSARQRVYDNIDSATKFWREGGYLNNPSAEKIPDKLHDASMQLMGQRDLRESLLEAVGKDYSDFNDEQVDKDLTNYFAILPRTEDGAVNWQETIKRREAFISDLTAQDTKRGRDIELMLDVLEGRRHPVMQDFRKDMQTLESMKYPFGVASSGATEAFQAVNPQADLIMWKWYGSALNSTTGVEQALAQLDSGMTRMPVKLSGVGRRIDIDRAAWDFNGRKVYDLWSSIKDTKEASAATIKQRMLKASPELNATLLYWGFGTQRLYTPAAATVLDTLMSQSQTVNPQAWTDQMAGGVTAYYRLTGSQRKEVVALVPEIEGLVAAWRYYMFSSVPQFTTRQARDMFVRMTGIDPALVVVDPRKTLDEEVE